jgi:hypothetical protein
VEEERRYTEARAMGNIDLELLTRYVKRGDPEALVELADRHRDMVYATCYRLLGSRADAEDAALSQSALCLRQALHHEGVPPGVGLQEVVGQTQPNDQRQARLVAPPYSVLEGMVAAGTLRGLHPIET